MAVKQPDWNEAPEDATHYGNNSGRWVECWYKYVDGERYFWRLDKALNGWNKNTSDERRPDSELIERPSIGENSWLT